MREREQPLQTTQHNILGERKALKKVYVSPEKVFRG